MTHAERLNGQSICKGLAALAFMLAAATLGGRAWAADAPAAPATVQLGAVALPIVVQGRLVNYVFTTIKLHLAAGADGSAVRAKEPYFRDALVRAGHRNPFTLPADYTHVDVVRVRAQVMSDAVAIVGRGVVHDAEIVKQVPQRRTGLPSTTVRPPDPELIP